MPYIKVDLQKISEYSSTVQSVQNKTNRIRTNFSSTGNSLDWDVTSSSNIQRRLSAIVIVKNRNKTSTADMFHKIDVLQNRKKKNINVILEALETQSINKIGNEMYNAFSAIDSDENDLIQKQFLSLGAAGTCLSGSGPSNIGLFEFYSDAEKAYEYFAKLGMNSYIAEPITSFNFLKPKLITSNC